MHHISITVTKTYKKKSNQSVKIEIFMCVCFLSDVLEKKVIGKMKKNSTS